MRMNRPKSGMFSNFPGHSHNVWCQATTLSSPGIVLTTEVQGVDSWDQHQRSMSCTSINVSWLVYRWISTGIKGKKGCPGFYYSYFIWAQTKLQAWIFSQLPHSSLNSFPSFITVELTPTPKEQHTKRSWKPVATGKVMSTQQLSAILTVVSALLIACAVLLAWRYTSLS